MILFFRQIAEIWIVHLFAWMLDDLDTWYMFHVLLDIMRC
jgi:hypothetical protein